MLLDDNSQARIGFAQRVLRLETSQQPTGVFGRGRRPVILFPADRQSLGLLDDVEKVTWHVPRMCGGEPSCSAVLDRDQRSATRWIDHQAIILFLIKPSVGRGPVRRCMMV